MNIEHFAKNSLTTWSTCLLFCLAGYDLVWVIDGERELHDENPTGFGRLSDMIEFLSQPQSTGVYEKFT